MHALDFIVAPLILIAIAMPHRARCAPGFYVNGARDGTYECRRSYSLPDDCTKKSNCVERPDPLAGSYTGRIYCTNGMITVQDGSSVWCAWRNR